MSQQRFTIVIEHGAFKGASLHDGALDPQPLSLAALVALLPNINAAALAEVETLKVALAAAPKPEELAALTAELEALRNQPPSPEVSKLTIMRRLIALGKWTTFKAVLADLPEEVQDAWTLAQAIRSDDPLFIANSAALKASLGVTEEQFTGLLVP